MINFKNFNRMTKKNGMKLICISIVILFLGIALISIIKFTYTLRHKSQPTANIEINDFLGTLVTLKTGYSATSKTASVYYDEGLDNKIKIVEQRYDFSNVWKTNNLEGVIKGAEIFMESNGGIKQHFNYLSNEFIFATFKKNISSDDCHFASLINLTKKLEIFRTPCLSKNSLFDFNGIGGGFAIRDDILYLAIGSPEYTSAVIRNFSQDRKSPYGKVLEFDAQRLLYSPKDIYKFKIYTIGHRNPQGLVNLDGELYEVEHGPKGGDEINFLTRSNNYGWPIYSLGSPYPSENQIAYKPASISSGFKNPMYSFIPSIGISDIRSCPEAISLRYKPLKCLLVSSLRAKSLFIVIFRGDTHEVLSAERVLIGMRIREFAKGSGDRIIFSVDDAPKESSGVYELKITSTLQ